MGRKSLNKTYEQILEQKRIYAKQYYALNKTEVNRKVMERYNKLKRQSTK